MNYFEALGLKIQLNLSENTLRENYIRVSKECHPDLYTLESDTIQFEMEEKSSYINKAYMELKSPAGRAQEVLRIFGLQPELQAPLAPDFLMEMMELNELKESNREQALNQIAILQEQHLEQLKEVFQSFDAAPDENKSAEAARLAPLLITIKYLERLEQ